MAVSQKTLDSIKAAPLSKVVEQTGGLLKRVGREFVTKCLWHDDANPSLTINDQKGFCFCHVCREGGDAIQYLRKAKGLSMPEAAEMAASILGVRFETDGVSAEEQARRSEERRRALAALEAEQSKYKANLFHEKAKRIRQILTDRGLNKEAATEFGLGFAPTGFFGGRITIPIHNHKGELVGFTGRATKAEQGAKYKNSADSYLFNKKALIFNEHRAYPAAIEAGSLIFVEGHLDVVSMWKAGIKNVVAAQGTGAPDPLVLQRLARNIKSFILCFDGDAGGKKAVEQYLSVVGPMAQKGEVSVSVVSLPEGQDPDEVIRSGGDLYSMIAGAPSWLDWTIDSWAADLDLTDTAMVTAVEKNLRDLIDGLRSRALRTHYIDRAARVLGGDAKEAEKIAKGWGEGVHYVARTDDWKPRSPHEIRTAVERRMTRIYVHLPEQRDTLRPMMDQLTSPVLQWLWKRLQELEACSTVDLTPHSVMAVVAVAEPHFMQQIRTLVRPNVTVDASEGVIPHISDIMGKDLTQDQNELDPDQSLT